MNIACIGGGPAGLYFSLLIKQAFPQTKVRVFERNALDDTFGWGVVFSDETLSNFEAADAPSYRRIREKFAYWGAIDTYYGGTRVRSNGHGFCGMARRELLKIFHERALEVGVEVLHRHEIKAVEEVEPADLILAVDGIQSAVRTRFAQHFKPSIELRSCRFCWLGTTLPLEAFTFWFKDSPEGLWQIHAYPFQIAKGGQPGLSTFIAECHEDTWKRAGLERADEARTVAYLEALFADELRGHRLLTNKSIWRQFPIVRCERLYHGKIVLLGDAAHTAHFSIGSGTKLAMEDAIALCSAFVLHGTEDVPKVLEAYEESRRLEVLKLQRAAQTSLEWFENSRRYTSQHPLQFSFNLMTRSKRITWDKLEQRDPLLVGETRAWFAQAQGAPKNAAGAWPAPIFTPLRLRGLTLANRLVVSPMCQYSALEGRPTDWHLVHLGSRAIGGAGLLIAEATAVSAEGRITYGCTGLWNQAQATVWKRIVDFAHAHGPGAIGLQIGHAGRKASCSLPWDGDAPLRDASAWPTIGPSAEPYNRGWHVPRAMQRADMQRVLADFVNSAQLALQAGFDLLELHMAHGYLLSSFLSPLSNLRDDDYGGTLQKRLRFPSEVLEAVRAVWPADKPLSVRISASDWLDDEGGQTIADSVEIAKRFAALGADLIDVSSAANSPRSKPNYGRMYQVPFAERIKAEVKVAVMAVGAIQDADQANTVIAAGRADLCALARPHLFDPYLTLHAAARYGQYEQSWPKPYLAVKPRPARQGEES